MSAIELEAYIEQLESMLEDCETVLKRMGYTGLASNVRALLASGLPSEPTETKKGPR